jgi:hypothetical protein
MALCPGTPLEVTLHSPQERLTVQGTIVWAEPPDRGNPDGSVRHGLRFTALDSSLSTMLGLLLADPL